MNTDSPTNRAARDGGVWALLVAAGTLAGLIPAVAAARVNPIEALREE